MLRRPCKRKDSKHYPGAVVVWVAILLPLMMGIAALAIDLGHLRVVKSQLQNAADAAAMAGVSGLLRPPGTITPNPEDYANTARARAIAYAGKHSASGKMIQINISDIVVGNISQPKYLNEGIAAGVSPYNAVRVQVQKNTSSANGPAKLFFASIWGKGTTSISVEATAYIEKKVLYKAGGPLIPVAVSKQVWDNDITNGLGVDNYGYDSSTGVTSGADGIREVSIYPDRAVPGDFGLLNFIDGNNASSTIGDQIKNNLTADDLQRTIGTSTLTFHDSSGNPTTYNVSGTPGLTASLKDDFALRIGTVVGFFVYSNATESGSNANFTITAIEYGRLMSVQLNGNNKCVIIQPVVYTGPDLIPDDDATQDANTAARIELIR